jgi:hypothetical protein
MSFKIFEHNFAIISAIVPWKWLLLFYAYKGGIKHYCDSLTFLGYVFKKLNLQQSRAECTEATKYFTMLNSPC